MLHDMTSFASVDASSSHVSQTPRNETSPSTKEKSHLLRPKNFQNAVLNVSPCVRSCTSSRLGIVRLCESETSLYPENWFHQAWTSPAAAQPLSQLAP